MIRKVLDQITRTDLSELCESKTPEGRTLEFKCQLPGFRDKDRFEFAKDVAALANSDGGDILYGISEDQGCASSLSSLVDVDQDKERARLGQILDSAVDPRIPSFDMRFVEEGDDVFLIVRVLSSPAGPHRVIQNDNSRFVTRDVNYVRSMTYQEIRRAFLEGGEFQSLVDAEQDRAIIALEQKSTWRPIIEGPASAFQLIPFSTTTGRISKDVVTDFGTGDYIVMPNWGGGSRAVNVDGVIYYTGGSSSELYAYVAVRRNCVMEHLTFSGKFNGGEKIVPALSLADDVRAAAKKFRSLQIAAGITGRAALTLSIVGVKDHALATGGRFLSQLPIADRAILKLPPVQIENLEDEGEFSASVRSLLDYAWQSFGLYSCSYYDDVGNWKDPMGSIS